MMETPRSGVHDVHGIQSSGGRIEKEVDVMEDRIFEEKLKEIKELEDCARSHEEIAACLRVELRAIQLELDDEHDESFGLTLERVAALPEDKVVCEFRRLLAESRYAEVLEGMIDNAAEHLDPGTIEVIRYRLRAAARQSGVEPAERPYKLKSKRLQLHIPELRGR